MTTENKFQDLMGIGNTKEFKPYHTEDGWFVILPGEEDGRRVTNQKKLVAVSKVDIKLSSKEDLDICIKHLEESDRRLRMIPTASWDWQKVMIKDFNVRFGVAWYDVTFFEQKKEAYLGEYHTRLYSHFGATADNFKVEHFIVNEKGEFLEKVN